jgi:uncharacterized protein
MRATTRTFILAVVALLIFSAGLVFERVSAQTPEPQPVQEPGSIVRTLAVNGTGQVSAVPDRAFFRIGVETEADTAQAALQENSAQMQSLLTALRQQGVNNQDIQTQTVQLFPRYDHQPDRVGRPELVGYTAANIVEVRVTNLRNLGSLIDAAVTAGGNTIEGIRFEVSDREAALQQGRELAVQNARQKAEQLARVAGVQLGDILTIEETSFQPIFSDRAIPAAEMMDVPVEPGAQALSVEIRVTWLLR